MKFFKGFILGATFSMGAYMLCSENTKCERRKIIKCGRKMMKNIGFM